MYNLIEITRNHGHFTADFSFKKWSPGAAMRRLRPRDTPLRRLWASPAPGAWCGDAGRCLWRSPGPRAAAAAKRCLGRAAPTLSHWEWWLYPLVMSKKLWKYIWLIDDLAIKYGDFPVRYVNVYQRVIDL